MLPTSPMSVPSSPTLPKRPTRRVVTVGRNDDNAALLEETTHSLGYLFDSVTSSDGLDDLLADTQSISLVVVDVKSVTERVRRLCHRLHDHGVSVLVLTSHLSSAFESRLRHTPTLTARQKPIERTALAQLVRSLAG